MAVSAEAVVADALEGPEGVDAPGVGVATSVVCLTLIDVLKGGKFTSRVNTIIWIR